MSTTDKVLFYLLGRRNPRIQRAFGYYYFDTEGNQYLDATSGAYNCVLGHTMPKRLAQVLLEQTEKVNFATLAYFQNDAADRLADQLLKLMPDYAAMGFYQSGSDAVEAAVRCALQVARTRNNAARSKIVGRRGGYHGATLGMMALSGVGMSSGMIRQQDFPNFLHIESQDCFNCPFGLKYPDCEVKCASSLRRLIENENPETIAAFVAEPSTKGGPVPDEYWPQIRAICDDYGILLISDEILEGMWRTGPAVALKRWGVSPDIVATGKVLGAGFMPIFPTLVTEAVRDTLSQSGSFWGGHAYSGHILSCEVALAVLEEIESRQLSSIGVESVGRQLSTVLGRMCERVDGAKMAVLGTLARLRIPCAVTGDLQVFYRKTQSHLQASGLHALIREVQEDHIEVVFAPPFIADEEFFLELEARLGRFLERLPLNATTGRAFVSAIGKRA